MKKIPLKFVTFLLAVLIMLTPVTALAEVAYPDGYTEDDTEKIVSSLSSVINLVLPNFTDDLSNTVYSSFCNDKTVNTLFKTIYSEMTENADTLKYLGIDLSPEALADKFSEYRNVSLAMQESSSLTEIVSKADILVWNVSDRDDFAKAVACVFSPFDDVLYTLLCGGTLKLSSLLSITGGNGYEDVIVPILNILNCPSVQSQSEYTRASAKRENMIIHIFNMVYRSIDEILASPMDSLIDILPKVAAYLNDGKLSDALSLLIEPITLNIGSLKIPGIAKLLENIINIETSPDISTMIDDIDLSEIAGTDIDFKLPEINLSDLAECATASGDTYQTDTAQSFMTILYWLIDALKLNESEITKLIGTDESIEKAVSSLMSKSNTELAGIIFYLFIDAGDTQANTGVTYSYPAVTETTVNPPVGMTNEMLQAVLDGIDPLIEEILQESDKDAKLEDTIKTAIYSNSVIKTLSSALYNIFSDDSIKSLLSILNISPVYGYSRFTDGNEKGFKKALLQLLSPYTALFEYLLFEGQLNIADCITLGGSDGYNTVIIPLLEGIGCNPDLILSYSECHKTGVDMLSDILNPIFDMIEKIAQTPVKTICEKIPQIIYFINSLDIKALAENLLYPISNIAEKAGLGDLINISDILGDTTKIDLNKIITEADLTADLGIVLPDIDINQFQNYGTPATLTSKRTDNGNATTYTTINGNAQSVLTVILQLLVKTIRMDENSGLLTGLMSSGDSDGTDMISSFAGSLTDKFADMSDDEIIVWLYNLLFREKPKVETTAKDEFIPTIIYEAEKKTYTKQIIIGVSTVIIIAGGLFLLLKKLGYLERY